MPLLNERSVSVIERLQQDMAQPSTDAPNSP
jgi:hypothetical protein